MVSQSNLVAATFEHPADAEAAVKQLGTAGFGVGDISLMYTDTGHVTGQGVVEGAVFGGVLGGLVGLLFPPLGMVIAAGPILGTLASAISSASFVGVAGAALNGLVSALVQLGMPQDMADRFGNHVHRGDTLVVVHAAPAEADKARQILQQHNPRTDAGAVGVASTAPAAS